MKLSNRYILSIFSVLSSLIFTSCGDEIDWSENYYRDSKEPYGAQSIYEMLPEIMEGEKVEIMPKSIKTLLPEALKDTLKDLSFDSLYILDTLDLEKANFLFVKRDFQMSPGDANALQTLVRNGCHAIVASNDFGTTFSNNYEFELATVEGYNYLEPDTALLNMKFKSVFYLAEKGSIEFQVREKVVRNYFIDYYPPFEPVLTDSADNALAIHAKMGKGSITICSSPKIFSNWQLIHSNYRLLDRFFSLIPVQKTYWANNYVSRDPKTKIKEKFKKSHKSKWDFIFSNPAITWAFWLITAGGLLYILNYMRRKQLPFKYKPEIKNMTLSYISSVAQLYMKGSSHSEILKKKSDLFFWNLNRKYGFSKTEPQENLVLFLSKRITDLKPEEIRESLRIVHEAQEGIKVTGASVAVAFKKIDRLKNRL